MLIIIKTSHNWNAVKLRGKSNYVSSLLTSPWVLSDLCFNIVMRVDCWSTRYCNLFSSSNSSTFVAIMLWSDNSRAGYMYSYVTRKQNVRKQYKSRH